MQEGVMTKRLVDPDGVRPLGAMARECFVPERWLRTRIGAGEVDSVRVGYNIFVPVTEAAQIKQLAAAHRKRLNRGQPT